MQNYKEKIPVLNVSQSNLKTHVEMLSYYYAPRTIEYGTLNATARYIFKEFGKQGNVQYQPYWTLVSRYKNVVLELGPETEEVLVMD